MSRLLLAIFALNILSGCATTSTSDYQKDLNEKTEYYANEYSDCIDEYGESNPYCVSLHSKFTYFFNRTNADDIKLKNANLKYKNEMYIEKIKSQSDEISTLENTLRRVEFDLKYAKDASAKSKATSKSFQTEVERLRVKTTELEKSINDTKELHTTALTMLDIANKDKDKCVEALESESSETMFLELANRKETVISKNNFGYTFESKAGYDSNLCQDENFGHKVCVVKDFPQKFVGDQMLFLHFDKEHGLYEIRSLIPNTDQDFIRALLYKKYGAPKNADKNLWVSNGRIVHLTQNLDRDVMIVYRGSNYEKAMEALSNRRADGL